MRILHLLNHTRRMNGHVHAAVDLACAQQKLGHTVAVGSAGGDFDDLLSRHGVETFTVQHERKLSPLIAGVRALNRIVREWECDVVHAHMMTSAVIGWPICSTSRASLVTTVHNEFEKSSILMGLGKRVIAVSDAVGQSMINRGVSKSRLRVVLNGTIGAARFEGRDTSPMSLARPAIAFVGGLHPRKGLDDLFKAFEIVHKQHPNAHLYIAGDGPFLEAYKSTVASLECANSVEFLGSMDNPYRLLRGADIFVLSSHADPAPLVLSEAREAGCAIIATDVDGAPQLLERGAAGLLVPPHSPDAIAEAIRGLLSDPDKLAELRANSQINIQHMNIDRVARETIAVYEEARGGKRSYFAGQARSLHLGS